MIGRSSDCLYNKTLQRDWKIAHSWRPKPRRSAFVLTQQEVSPLLAAAEPGKARMLFTTMYGCGLRVSEGLALEVTDIDSQRKVIHVRQGKGRKDRYVPLGESLLMQLRDYWCTYKPSRYLFPGSQAEKAWNVTAVRQEFRLAMRIAGIDKPSTTHTAGLVAGVLGVIVTQHRLNPFERLPGNILPFTSAGTKTFCVYRKGKGRPRRIDVGRYMAGSCRYVSNARGNLCAADVRLLTRDHLFIRIAGHTALRPNSETRRLSGEPAFFPAIREVCQGSIPRSERSKNQ